MAKPNKMIKIINSLLLIKIMYLISNKKLIKIKRCFNRLCKVKGLDKCQKEMNSLKQTIKTEILIKIYQKI